MPPIHTLRPRLWPILLLAAASGAHASCGAAFCSVNSDWASDAVSAGAGQSLDVRYERIVQDVPRTGTRRVAVGEIPHHHDEVRTRNRNLVLTYNRNFESGWGYSLVLPWTDRDHLHVHNHRGAQVPERWEFRQLGDMRLLGRYQVHRGDTDDVRVVGLVGGVKLPTGRTDVANDLGDVAERSLQPGTGTVDVIVGAFYQRGLPDGAGSVYAQAQYQHPLREKDGYRPGGQLSADLGYARQVREHLAALLQLNAVVKRRDAGSQAEPGDSGSRALFLSPGLSYDLGSARLYGFYQQPLRQSVNGVQLTAGGGLVVGLTTRF